jgi:dTDP-4-dehydrorhamnose reductase
MNILVTGANGQLGNELRVISSNSPYKFIFSDIIDSQNLDTLIVDITDFNAVRQIVNDYSIDVIINCAAYNNVPKAEEDMLGCDAINVDAPMNLASIMSEAGGFLIHFSSDYVFGGEAYNTPRSESQKCTPTGVYGKSKLLGEQAVRNSGCKHVIIRTSWLYSEFGTNFCKTMMNLISTKPVIKVVFDQVGTPTYALDLANAVAVILDDYNAKKDSSVYDKAGIYHYSNEGVCSWYDFTQMIAEYAGSTSCDIQPCHSNEFPSPVTRPSYSVLDKTKIKESFGIKIPYWTDSLKKCISNLKSQN